MLDYKDAYAANFMLSFDRFESVSDNQSTIVFVKVKNTGNLTDVGKLTLFADGIQTDDVHHFELTPGQEKVIRFEVARQNLKNVTVTSKHSCISHNF